MKYKGLIFDLDGVICTTDGYHFKAWKILADKLNIHFDEERNNLLRGVSRMESLDLMLNERKDDFTEEEKVSMATEKNDYYRESLKEITPEDLSKDVYDSLVKLKNDGYKLAIGSSSKNARFILERLGLLDFFHKIIDGTDIENSKPHPEVFLKAASALGLEPNECVVVEDAVAGIEAGLAGNFDVIGIGDATKSDLITLKVEKFSEILNLV